MYPFCFHHPFYTGKIIIERKFIDVYMCSIACRLQHLIRAATVNCILGPLMLLLRLLTWLRIWNISIIYHKTLNHFHSVVALLLVSSLETHPQSSIHARSLNRCRGEWSNVGQFFFFSHISQHKRPILFFLHFHVFPT